MKAIQKKSELSPIESIRREMDRFFDDIVPFSRREGGDGMRMELWAPDTDVSETDEEYIVSVDLPGISKEDVEVSYKDNRLTISGERQHEEKEEKEDFLRKERYHGSFTRSFTLPSAGKDDKIKARFKDGVLKVTVPKAEVQKPKTVPID
ncbi:heat shock protein Hsp20 [Fodinibius roseus]|uniref:Heat shock protein Hsp20 n=1 Tax=Fodinibius roseus TaxID=1194090 RepID=A0A1M4X985_9BACT|nr:Hsp20/alpha crystallin family protein [Fodinibius roseus]SHE90079.1 heat shock protein Hsp20 [Fodinibius roseus]